MKLSTRARYGIRAMFELAVNYNGKPMPIKTISRNQDISKKYLHSLLTILRSTGFVRSVLGSSGGFALTRHPSQITFFEIVTALEGPLSIVDCVTDNSICDRSIDCASKEIWTEVNNAIEKVLSSTTLEDLVIKSGGKIRSKPEYFI